MYWEHYGFKEPPFALTPNPAFLFLSSPHQEAFAHLLFAIENRVGFIELSGEVGTGKTTIVRTLLNQLDPEIYRTALIFNPTLSPLGLLKEINQELGIAPAGEEMRDLHQALNLFLLEENSAGRTVVLVIDEAQNLPVEVLEQIRLISNLETDSAKLIQIVLVGQPELNRLLSRPELRQLDQRITVRYHLNSMGFADTVDYIRHRIRFAAGGNEPLTFSPGAAKRIFRFSGGLPRLINGVCDRALLLAYTREAKEVSPSMASLAMADLRKERAPRRGGVLIKGAAFCSLLAVIALSAISLLPDRQPPHTDSPQRQTAQPLSRAAAESAIAATSGQENLYAAVNAILAAWEAPPVIPVQGVAASLRSLARQRGFTATKLAGTLEEIARLDAPTLLHLSIPGNAARFVALVGIGEEGVAVAPPVAGRSTLTHEELAAIWDGDATLLWKDFHDIASRVDKVEGVKLLQGLLRQVGCYSGPLNGTFGPQTRDALAEFQGREQVTVDGKAGGQTLLLLYRRAGGFFPPSLSRGENGQKGSGGSAGYRSGKAGRNG